MPDIVNVDVTGGTIKVTAGDPTTNIVVNPPTVQEELLAANKTCVESVSRLFAEYPHMSQGSSWAHVHAAKRLAEQAIARAESEVDDA